METIILNLRLFWEFFKTGLFAVGGGLATLPFLQEMGRNTSWFGDTEIADMVAVSESTPGPLGVNMATYVGFSSSGIFGGVIATLGLITPSIIIIIMIAGILDKFRNSQTVKYIFNGLRPASTALILSAGISLVKIALLNIDSWNISGYLPDLFNLPLIGLALIVFFLYRLGQKKKLHPIIFIFASAVIGIIFSL